MAATIKCDTLQNASSAAVNLTLDTAGNATVGNTLAMGTSFVRNRIINGAMDVAQRGTSFTTPAQTTYTVDRWFINYAGAPAASVAQVAGPAGFKNALQVTGSASNTAINILQRIESINCADLSGATITIQATISASSAQTFYWSLYYAGAQDSWGTNALITSGTWSVTTTATKFTATITGLPSSATNGLQLVFAPNNNGAFTSGTFTITGVQLELGSIATAFERELYSVTLAKCQRYYYQGILPGVGIANTTTTIARFNAKLPTTMRANPTISLGSNVTFYDGSVTSAMSGTISTSYSTVDALSFDSPATLTGLTVGRPIVPLLTSGGYFTVSAEL